MLDFQQLAQPLTGDSPTGFYLKNERAVYRGLRNAFNQGQSSFRRLTETPESSEDESLFEENQNNWQQVSELCWNTLTQDSKDIEIFCWWLTAQAFMSQPLARIAEGLTQFAQLFEQFGEQLQPLTPENKLKGETEEEKAKDRTELQLRPLLQLVGESENSGLLYTPLQLMSLVGDIDHTQYVNASNAGTLDALKASAKTQFAQVRQEVNDSILALDKSIQALDKLHTLIAARCQSLGIAAVNCRFLKDNFARCLQAIKFLVGDMFIRWPLDKVEEVAPAPVAEEQPVQEQGAATVTTNTSAATPAPQATGFNPAVNLQSRDQAFVELKRIAEYFRKAEPHSPVSFLLEKAIRWGYMSLPELMTELLSGNDKMIEQINLVTGLDNDNVDIDTSVPVPEPAAASVEPQPAPQAPTASADATTDDAKVSSDFQW